MLHLNQAKYESDRMKYSISLYFKEQYLLSGSWAFAKQVVALKRKSDIRMYVRGYESTRWHHDISERPIEWGYYWVPLAQCTIVYCKLCQVSECRRDKGSVRGAHRRLIGVDRRRVTMQWWHATANPHANNTFVTISRYELSPRDTEPRDGDGWVAHRWFQSTAYIFLPFLSANHSNH